MTLSKIQIAITTACVLAAASHAFAAAGDASLILNGQPAKEGTYKPQDIDSLVISSGNVRITFAKDP
ncbi:MAG TPA: hypothetical protein VHM90_07575, partial [Phycisphaerae bacterium]|nr:hypothetical protein [Phycisphaerae bacterium]